MRRDQVIDLGVGKHIWPPEEGEDGWLIAWHAWMPGAYDSERTARFAFEFPDETLRAIMDKVTASDPNGLITYAMLEEAKDASR